MRLPAVPCLILAASACSGKPAVTTPPPTDPSAAVVQFLTAVKAKNYARMGELWGTAKNGPAVRYMKADELEKRLIIMQSYLAHEQYLVEPTSLPGLSADQRVVRVRLTRRGCAPVVPFTMVRYREGWLVYEVDLQAAGNPAKPCAQPTP